MDISNEKVRFMFREWNNRKAIMLFFTFDCDYGWAKRSYEITEIYPFFGGKWINVHWYENNRFFIKEDNGFGQGYKQIEGTGDVSCTSTLGGMRKRFWKELEEMDITLKDYCESLV